MKWQRKLKRRPLITYLDVTHVAEGRRLGRADEITIEGMHVLAVEALSVGGLYTLRVQLPTEIKGMLYFDVDVRCAACPQSSNPDLYDAHIQFIYPPPDAVEAIEELNGRFAR